MFAEYAMDPTAGKEHSAFTGRPCSVSFSSSLEERDLA